jgi:hypothetical protein
MRVWDWNQQLADGIERWRSRERVFGQSDCCQFVGDIVFALTGTDHRGQFPAYSDEAGALAILAEQGGMVALLSGIWGEPKPVAFARVGDVVAGDFGEGIGCGICVGVNTATVASSGLQFYPTLAAVAAWSI